MLLPVITPDSKNPLQTNVCSEQHFHNSKAGKIMKYSKEESHAIYA